MLEGAWMKKRREESGVLVVLDLRTAFKAQLFFYNDEETLRSLLLDREEPSPSAVSTLVLIPTLERELSDGRRKEVSSSLPSAVMLGRRRRG